MLSTCILKETPGLARILQEGVGLILCIDARRRKIETIFLEEGGLYLCSDAKGRKIEMVDQGWGVVGRRRTITLMSASLNNMTNSKYRKLHSFGLVFFFASFFLYRLYGAVATASVCELIQFSAHLIEPHCVRK